jgi:DNA-binding NtrC family response regulator
VKFRDAMLSAGRAYLYRVLSESGGDVRRAAVIAGVNRTTMYKLLPKYGIAIERKASVKPVEPLCKYPVKP